ncbi:MAG: hypothetical protein IH600_04320 [Bacteroidetes bacterium]|nr:hypothetical protein [Bacteroidota bacterium]
MPREVIAVIAVILIATSIATAQESLPKLSVQCDGSSVVIHNQSESRIVLSNVSLLWEGRSDIWWEYNPDHDVALMADESREIGYAEFVKNYDPVKDQGMPWNITLGVKADAPYPALLSYSRSEKGSYNLNETMSMFINPTELKKQMEESKAR